MASPHPVDPAAPRPSAARGWAASVGVAVVVGLAVGGFAASHAPWRDELAGGTQVATQVAGVSIERSSVEPAPTTVAVTTTPPAPASVPITTTAPAPAAAPAPAVSPQEQMRRDVLAQIAFPWQEVLPAWRIEFLPERKGYRGSTFPKQRLIQIYLRPGLTVDDYVHVTAHELGHAVDVTLLDAADHRRWNQERGRPADAAWWVASGADDFSSGAGDWAECFAWWQMPRGRFYSEVGPVPSDAQLAVLADIVAS